MRKKHIISFIIFNFSLGLFFYRVGVVNSDVISIQDTQAPQIEAKGYIGAKYGITANNIVVHLKDLPKLDIWRASKATVYSKVPVETTLNNLTPLIKSTTLKEEVGVYTAELGIEEDTTIQKIVYIFVVGDKSVMDDKTLLVGQDFQLTKEKKNSINNRNVKEIANVHAYDLLSGKDITLEVEVNTKDLGLYLAEDEYTVPLNFSVRKLNLEIEASTLLNNSSIFENPNIFKGTNSSSLPNTGDRNNFTLFVLGILLLVLSFVFIIFKFLSKNKLKNEKETK